MRVAMILSGLGRVQRGAEAAFLEIAGGLARHPDTHVEMFGSGPVDVPGVLSHVIDCPPRERFEGWPRIPCLRGESSYEEALFTKNLAHSGAFRAERFDVVLNCTYPWVHWYVQRQCRARSRRTRHVFVTQNGDWPCQARNREFRRFRCDGLICTNPVYFERHKDRYTSTLIPNGVDPARFHERRGPVLGSAFDVEEIRGRRVVVMASAMIPTKRVAEGVRAVAQVDDLFLLVAGDGPERDHVAALAAELLPGRHRLLGSLPRAEMPSLLRRADLFLHMSREEPSALVYAEAACTGLPIVADDNAVTRWTLGDAALLVDAGDVACVADGLRRAIEPERAAALGAAARRRVLDGWTWQFLADRYRTFFRQLLHENTDEPQPWGTPSNSRSSSSASGLAIS